MGTTEQRDREVLFTVLAVRLELVTPAAVLEVLKAGSEGVGSLAGRLVAAGVLTGESRDLVEKMVEDAVRACQGDVRRTLQSIGGERALRSCFGVQVRRDAEGRLALHEALSKTPVGDATTTVTMEHPGRYTLVNEHGHGGQSRVYRAFDEHVRREVAFKELLGKPGDESDETTARFVREARITGMLEHPSIVPVYEIGRRPDGRLYYTMKLVRGETLAGEIARCVTLADRLRLLDRFREVCSAVAYAHGQGVLHRDLKPENVMLGAFGETIVLDWGLARRLQDASEGESTGAEGQPDLWAGLPTGQTAAGSVMGTPAYMSPEAARGDQSRVGERSDVWGLGAILYEILTGRPPMQGQNVMEILMKLLEGERVAPAREVCSDVPPELSALAARALEPDPERRMARAADLEDEIRRWQRGEFLRSYRYSTWEILRRLTARHRRTLVAALAAYSLVLGVLLWQQGRLRVETATARQHRDAALGFAEKLLYRYGPAVRDLDGSTLVRDRLLFRLVEYYSAQGGPDQAGPADRVRLARAWLEIASLSKDLGRVEEQQRSLLQALAALEGLPDPTLESRRLQARARSELAGVLLVLGANERARAFYEQAAQAQDALLAEAGGGAEGVLDRIDTCQGQARLDELEDRAASAEADLHRALELLRKLASTGQPDLASRSRAVEIGLHESLARLERSRHRTDVEASEEQQAIALARAALQEAPEDAGRQEQLASVLARAGQYAQALRVARGTWESQPRRWRYAFRLAELWLALGKPQEAAEITRSALALASGETDREVFSLVLAAVAADLRGLPAEARSALQRARRLATKTRWKRSPLDLALLEQVFRDSSSPRAAALFPLVEALSPVPPRRLSDETVLQALEAYEATLP